MSQPQLNRRQRVPKFLRTRWAKAALALLALLLVYAYTRGGGETASTGTLFAAVRGDLRIAVTEGGNVEARESQTIKSKIKGETKILSIIDDGYLVTPEDVANKKVLVTLDNSKLLETMTQETIQYESARADYAESTAQYEITVKQNESDIKKSELDAKFALMDFKRFLSDEIANAILKQRGLGDDVAEISNEIRKSVEENFVIPQAAREERKDGPAEKTQDEPAAPSPANGEKTDGTAQAGAQGAGEVGARTGRRRRPEGAGGGAPRGERPNQSAEATAETKGAPKAAAKDEASTVGGDLPADAEMAVTQGGKVVMSTIAITSTRPDIDFSTYAKPDALGDGEAQQKLRKLESDRLLAEGDLGLSETKLSGTRKLAEKNFVTKQELDNDEMSVKKQTVNRDSAETARDLFVKYEFPKEAEKLLSAYEEAIRAMERTMKQAIAKQAQAEARKKSSEASFGLRTDRQKDVQEQLAACTVVAERPGLVVYGGGDDGYRGNREPIQEGTTVYERQEIITIPDMTQMAVKVKVHESNIDKIKIGQKATIKFESFRDQELTGEVVKISVIPDSSTRWMNPDMKLYPATVAINGTYERLKPSMTADVEILVEELKDVVYVPMQAVQPLEGKRVVYVADAFGGQVAREVETGQFNNAFIEIKKGLEEGERVFLRAPNRQPGEEGKEDEKQEDSQPQQERRESAPPPRANGGAPPAA